MAGASASHAIELLLLLIRRISYCFGIRWFAILAITSLRLLLILLALLALLLGWSLWLSGCLLEILCVALEDTSFS